MAFHTDAQHHPGGRSRGDVWGFRVAFAATFVVMLVPTVLARLSLSSFGDKSGEHRSIFSEARARTDQIVPFMFMG